MLAVCYINNDCDTIIANISKVLQILLKAGCDVNAILTSDYLPVRQATALSIVRQKISSRYAIYIFSFSDFDDLNHNQGCLECVKILLENRADPHIPFMHPPLLITLNKSPQKPVGIAFLCLIRDLVCLLCEAKPVPTVVVDPSVHFLTKIIAYIYEYCCRKKTTSDREKQ